jgi:hypothetical protein
MGAATESVVRRPIGWKSTALFSRCFLQGEQSYWLLRSTLIGRLKSCCSTNGFHRTNHSRCNPASPDDRKPRLAGGQFTHDYRWPSAGSCSKGSNEPGASATGHQPSRARVSTPFAVEPFSSYQQRSDRPPRFELAEPSKTDGTTEPFEQAVRPGLDPGNVHGSSPATSVRLTRWSCSWSKRTCVCTAWRY